MGILIPVDLDRTVFDESYRKCKAYEIVTGRQVSRDTVLKYSVRELLEPDQIPKFSGLVDSPEYLHLDVPVSGAGDGLRGIRDLRFAIAYITGRHSEGDLSMEQGTLDSLRRHELPMPDGKEVFLFLKPNRAEGANSHKTQVFSKDIPPLGFERGPGIGDLPADAVVYVSQGYRPALMLRTDRTDDWAFDGIDDTMVFYHWSEMMEWIREHVRV